MKKTAWAPIRLQGRLKVSRRSLGILRPQNHSHYKKSSVWRLYVMTEFLFQKDNLLGLGTIFLNTVDLHQNIVPREKI